MSEEMLKYMMGGTAALFFIIVIAYMIVSKKAKSKNSLYVAELVKGTKQSAFSMELFYQKFYIVMSRVPFLKRYILKIRRRLEIINLEDEYVTRKQTAQICLKALIAIIPITILIVSLTKGDTLLMSASLLFGLFFIESLMSGAVDKIDNVLLRQQIDFFSEIRHAYHETNMVEEAIYEVAQADELEISRQAEKIYEILISDDPETELEKYYDIAPNSFLKEFAGVSYLTKEFGDRKDKDGASLYLKNLNNITQEMQLEILKRDKLDYVFQSISMIAAIPILGIQPIKSWAVDQFSFTQSFYDGASGLIMQIVCIVLTVICYILTRTLKDSGSINYTQNSQNPWQEKLYKKPYIKKIVDMFIPKRDTKTYRKLVKLLKDAASKLKMEWLYVNRLTIALVAFVVGFFIFAQVHSVTLMYVYTQPTTDYNIMGSMSDSDYKKAMKLTEQDNKFLDLLKSRTEIDEAGVRKELERSKEYEGVTEEELDTAAARIYDKLKTIQNEYLKWYELLLCFVLLGVGYYVPIWLLMFQVIMRQMEMEDEVMQFQTIILMLMKIERVNVEIILEWLERYANIFKEPISKCVNNFESGPWEALEELKQDITFMQLIRIVESLQAAVEKIPIKQAFDELDTERAYHQEKRKESNERLIKRKSMIGKVVGFGPMVFLFVGYLIVPLVFIGMTSMGSAFTSMSGMM